MTPFLRPISMLPRLLRYSLLFALPAVWCGCGGEKDEQARTAIHAAGFTYSVDDFLRAAREGKAEVVWQFLKAGMNPDAADAKGETAILAAAGGGQGHVVALLRDAGATTTAATPTGQTALMEAARAGDSQSVQVLLSAGADAEARDSAGMSPLAAAVMAGHTAVVALLVSAVTGSLDAPLQLAAMEGHTPVMAVLMDKGANPDATSVDGRTPMMFAAQYGRTEAVKLLRQRGAAVTALDENLRTAADHAEENGHDDLAAYLREPDRSADPNADEPAAPRLPDITWAGEPPATLETAAAALRMVDYRTRRLPVVVEEVLPDNSAARLRLLTGEEEFVTVAPGEEIPGTGLSVDTVRRRFTASKLGEGRLLDVSEVRLLESSTGRRFLAVKGLPALAGEGCALVQLPGSDTPVEARRGDTFTAGSLTVKFTDIRPSQLVLENPATGETATITRSGAR
jgi:ankyrin repeat protein